MQMDRMRHQRVVDQFKLHALPLLYPERCDVRPPLSAHRPGIGLHAAVKRDGSKEIRGTHEKRLCCGEPRLQRQVDRRCDGALIRNALDARARCSEDDSGPAWRAFELCEYGKGS